MQNPCIRRLGQGVRLTRDDCAVLAQLTRHTRHVEPRRTIFHEGELPSRPIAVLEGWACRWRMLGDGLRQITELVLPGDTCHPHIDLVAADYSFSTLSPCTVAEIDPAELETTMKDRPGVRCALRWSTLQAESILREMVTNNGRRQATARIAHLVCEVFARLRAVDLMEEGTCPWLLTQEDLSEVTSMTSVHANRSLKALREAGLIVTKYHVMRVPDIERLEEFCGFRSDYLHLGGPSVAP
jgi:CRP-like cAMP-binding protein